MPRSAPIAHWLTALAVGTAAACQGPAPCPPGDPACAESIPAQADPPGEGWGEAVEGPDEAGTIPEAPDPREMVDRDGDGYRPVDGDCDDGEARVHPGAVERCDGLDNDCNGAVDDGLGHTAVSETDALADGTADTVSYTTYRATGELWFRETDADADGLIDSSEEYTYVYDALGRLLHVDTDEGMDGTVDERKTYLYDALGRLASTEIDAGLDGVLDRIDTYVYDPVTGLRTAWEMDTEADGLPNTIYSYRYDPSGLLEGLVVDRFDGEGALSSTMHYAYDYLPSGRLGWVHVDLTADGELDNTTEYTYDGLGRTEQTATDYGRDGVFDSFTWYRYSPSTGALTTIEIDADGDAFLDTRINRWEECYDGP